MEWCDDGILLSARPLGETGAVAHLLTAAHGRHAGAVPGGQSGSLRAHLQPGTFFQATWHARLESQLGQWRLDPLPRGPGLFLQDRDRLSGLVSACALCETFLPERDPCPLLFSGLVTVLEALSMPDTPRLTWAGLLARWETLLLETVGFGLDVERCALSGIPEVDYVSPRTGCGVSAAHAGIWRDRLFPLPSFLRTPDAPPETTTDLFSAFRLTEHFLKRVGEGRPLPPARNRFMDRLNTW